MTAISNGGLYIHAAFCRMKCLYCDFYSIGARQADWGRYVDALIAELNYRISELPSPLRTIYIGGGTPSLMPCKDFLRLCEALKPYSGNVEEFTIEVNPDDVTPEMLDAWKRGGVNRLSIGIQSFDNSLLKSLKRRHSADAARRAYSMAREMIDNISIDLIYGIPGQSVEMWRKDLKEAIALRPEHISSYSLMYEEGTALTFLRNRGDVIETPEEVSELMMRILMEELHNAGYEHYEISNFALPGFRSRHNSSYWQLMPYLGLGPSAHSYDGGRCRSAVIADVRRYMDVWSPDALSRDSYCGNLDSSGLRALADDIITREYLTEVELREEYVMIRLRTKEGIDLADFKRRFGDVQYAQLLKRSEPLLERGSLLLKDNHLSVAEDSLLISDAIILDLA